MSDREIKKTFGLFDNALNKKLISRLKQNGEDLLVFPSIKTERLELSAAGENLLKNLSDFDWIIFADVYAADYFLARLAEFEIDFFELDNLTVCALGEAVADRLRFVQVHSDVIPSKLNPEAIFSTILDFAGGELNDVRFLITREKSCGLAISEKLKSGKANIEELPVYEAGFEEETANIKLKTLLKGGAVDEFIFSTPEDLLSLRFLFSEEDLTALLREIRVSATTEIVFQSLQETSLRPLYFHYK